ncbi:MAG: amidohydrolase family protein [Bryobacterales bacterium]|nr:amidohydrolase family protein [Bryobacterales bacterium]
MVAPLIVRGARQLLTLRESRGSGSGTSKDQLGLIEDGCFLIADGHIAEVGVWRRISNLQAARNARQLDASGCLVLPGFIDAEADLFAEPSSPPILRRRARSLLAHGTTSVCSPSPTTSRQLQIVSEEGLRVHPSVTGAIVLPCRDFFAQQPSVWPEGAVIGSGFDGQSNSPCGMLAAIAFACICSSVAIEQALQASTVRTAQRLGLEGSLGALVPGAQADFLLLDIPDYRQIPYHLGENPVRAVFQCGQRIYQRGEPFWRGESSNASPTSVKAGIRKP